MKHFDIFIREKRTEAKLYLQELVLRKELEGRDRLVLFSQGCPAVLRKFFSLKERLKLQCGVLSIGKTAYAGVNGRLALSEKLKIRSSAYAKAENKARLASSSPTLQLVRFRTLGEAFPLTLEAMGERAMEDLTLEKIE